MLLLDLSWSADEQTHFDEALDWANAARQISMAHGLCRSSHRLRWGTWAGLTTS